MQGPGNLCIAHAGRKNWGGSEGFPPTTTKETHVRNLL